MIRICDGRMSGTAYGTVVLHVAPESAAGGPLSLVRDGDMISLDVPNRRVDLDVPADELRRRQPSEVAGGLLQRSAAGLAAVVRRPRHAGRPGSRSGLPRRFQRRHRNPRFALTMSAPTTLVSAVPVPFDDNGDLDVNGQKTLLRHLLDAGIGGVFIAGTTGEFTALDDDERAAVLSAALEVYGADAVYMHVGAAAARQAESLTAQAVALGARRLAAITPFYLPCRSSGTDRLLPSVGRRRSATPESTSTCSPPAPAASSPRTNSPNWRRFRRSPGRRSAVSRHPKSCNTSG